MKLYGITNCTTVKKARTWLEEQGQTYEFHDFKKFSVSHDLAQTRCRHPGRHCRCRIGNGTDASTTIDHQAASS